MIVKNAFRLFKKRTLQFIGILIIIMISSMMFTGFAYTMEGIAKPTFVAFEESNREDFSIETTPLLTKEEFEYVTANCGVNSYVDIKTLEQISSSCFDEVLQMRINTIQKKHPLSLEVRKIKETTYDGIKYLVMNNMENINTTHVEKGELPMHGELALTPIYMENNGLEIGDDISVFGNKYNISGKVLFVDYSMPMIENSFIIDNSRQTFVALPDSEIDDLSFDNLYYYISGKGNAEQLINNKEQFPFITAVIETENQLRSGAIDMELQSGTAISVGISLLMASLALVFVGIVVTRMLAKERTQIGLLKALGYTNIEIGRSYILLLAIFSLPMLVLGHLGGYYLAGPLKAMFRQFYLLPAVDIGHIPLFIVLSIVVPFMFIITMAYFIIMFVLKDKALKMMSPILRVKKSKKTRKESKRKATTQFKYSLLLQNKWKFGVFAVGIFFATLLLAMGVTFVNRLDVMITDYYKTTNYEYEGFCNITGCPENVGEQTLELPLEYEGDIVNVIGLHSDSKLKLTYDDSFSSNSEKLSGDEVIVSKQFLKKYLVAVGEDIQVKLNDKLLDFTIVDVANNYIASTVYVELEYFQNQLGMDITTKVYANETLDENEFFSTVVKSDILEQATNMSDYVNISSLFFVVFSVLVGFIILYIIIGLTIEENFYSVSLLKVLGFSKKEVTNMVLSPYFFFVNIVYVLAVPLLIAILSGLERLMVEFFDVVMPMDLNWMYILLGLGVVNVMYFVGTIQAKRQIASISLQESLKLYQE